MKITIDINDSFYDDDSLSDHIKRIIKSNVASEVFAKINKEMTELIDITVKETLVKKVQKMATKLLKTNRFTPGYHDNNMPTGEDGKFSLEDYINYKMTDGCTHTSLKRHINGIAKDFGKDLRDKYDVLFASQIVAKLSDNGLLKDDMVKLILDNK